MTAKRKFLILILVLLVAVPLAGTIYAAQNNSTDQQPTPQAPLNSDQGQAAGAQQGQQTQGNNRKQQAAQATASPTISALGSVEPNKVASLVFQTTGTVSGVYVAVGDYVKAGEVLADLKSDDQWNTYNQAVLNLESAQIAMQQLKEPPSAEDLATAKANVTSAQASYNSTANSTTPAQLENAQVQYDQAQAQLAALKDARAHMGGTDAQITLQDAQIGAASFSAEIARLQLDQLKNPNNSASLWSASIRIKQAQLALEQLQQGPTAEQIKSSTDRHRPRSSHRLERRI